MKPHITLIGQNISIFSGDGKDQFARTGEIGFFHMKKAGATGVILGHSEVSDMPEIVNKKWKAALAHKVTDNIMLAGEDWEDLEKGWKGSSSDEIQAMKDSLREKLLTIMKDIPAEHIRDTVFGYEPSWGTHGSGKEGVELPQPDQIESMCGFFRMILGELYGDEVAQNVPIIYGGSSSPDRTREIMPSANVDGLILGSACKTTELVQQIGDGIIQATKQKGSKRKSVIACNWKAYELEESYKKFISVIQSFDGNAINAYLSPLVSDLREVHNNLTHPRN